MASAISAIAQRLHAMPQGSEVIRNGISVIQGTPRAPLAEPALFLRLWRVSAPGKPPRTLASLTVARPSPNGYVIKELIPDMGLGPQAALDKAIAVAKRGDVARVYVNADLGRLPPLRRSASG